MRLRAVRVDTNEEVQLSDGSLLLRFSPDEDAGVLRCLVRHIASGREAYIQGGANLRAFVKACLLRTEQPASGGAFLASEVAQGTAGEKQESRPTGAESTDADALQ